MSKIYETAREILEYLVELELKNKEKFVADEL